MNIAAIVAAVAFATGFGAAWQWQDGNIVKLQLESANERISQQRAARQTSERYATALGKAQDDAQIRRTVINSAVDSNGAGLIGLRIAASSVRASATTYSTRDAYADTVTELFGECSDSLVRMAGQADGHLSDIQTVTEAWPK